MLDGPCGGSVPAHSSSWGWCAAVPVHLFVNHIHLLTAIVAPSLRSRRAPKVGPSLVGSVRNSSGSGDWGDITYESRRCSAAHLIRAMALALTM